MPGMYCAQGIFLLQTATRGAAVLTRFPVIGVGLIARVAPIPAAAAAVPS